MINVRLDDDARHLATAPIAVGADGSDEAGEAVVWTAATAAPRGRKVTFEEAARCPVMLAHPADRGGSRRTS